jgi:membrane protease YdiL (CAAX protease family)
MAIALPLWWSREWRGSLLAPMAAHAIHNAVVTLVGVAQFRT